MLVHRAIADFRAWRAAWSGSVGLVPTMGYLHEGHLSLVRASKRECAITVATIFVNPTQFAPNEDLSTYPRDEARDLDLLKSEGVDAVLIPDATEIYPDGYSTYVEVEGLTSRLEGASRPTHFRGVTTVVMKLLQITQAQRAYFGQKDAQQLAIVRRMVRDLNLPTQIIGQPIVREPDGLAMSSRNVYLTPEQRQAALVLSRCVRMAEQWFANGVRDATAIRDEMHAMIAEEPLAEVDYVSVADAQTLEEINTIEAPALASLAVRFGSTRLIDNTILTP